MGCPWPWAPPWPARTGRCSRCRPTAARCTRSRRCGRWPASSSTSPSSSATTAPTRSWRTSWRGWVRPRTASAPASCCTWAGRRWTSSRWPPAWACPRPGPRPPRSWPSSCARHSPRPARTWSTRCCPAAGEVAARDPLRRLVRAGVAVAVVAVVLAVLTGLLWGLQRRLVYFPDDGPVPAAAAVRRSPFVDLGAVGAEHSPFLPVRALLRDRYPVAERVATIRVPTTVVLGDADSIVPPAQSRAVAAAAADLHRLVEVPGADHNDRVLLDGDAFVGAVVDLAGR